MKLLSQIWPCDSKKMWDSAVSLRVNKGMSNGSRKGEVMEDPLAHSKEMVGPNKRKHENKHLHQGTRVNSAGNYSTRKKSKDNRSKTGKEMGYSHNE